MTQSIRDCGFLVCSSHQTLIFRANFAQGKVVATLKQQSMSSCVNTAEFLQQTNQRADFSLKHQTKAGAPVTSVSTEFKDFLLRTGSSPNSGEREVSVSRLEQTEVVREKLLMTDRQRR